MGANDPMRTTTTPGSDALVAAITKALGLTLADRMGGSILGCPIIEAGFLGTTRLSGALGSKKIYVGWGADKLATAAEGDDLTVLTVGSSAATVTPARKGLARKYSDMLRGLDQWGLTDWANFTRDSTWAWQQTVVDVFAALFASFSATGCATGAAATWASVVEARNTLAIAKVPGPYVFVTRPKDWGNISVDALSLGGAVAQDPNTLRYLASPAPGFKGIYLDGDLWVYTTSEIDASGGDHVSAMFGAEAIAWDALVPTPSKGTQPVLWTPLFGVETHRDVLKSEDYVATTTHVGASIGINAAGIKMPYLT